MKAPEFVGLLFLSRDVAHSVHLSTKSYAKHVALNTFYEDIIPLADKFAETYQGRHGLMGPVGLQTVSKKSNDISVFLQEQLDKIEEVRYNISSKEDSSIQNIIDEIIGLYLSTLYKLKFLS